MKVIMRSMLVITSLGLIVIMPVATAQTAEPPTMIAPAAQPVVLDRVVAVINDEAITRRELDDAIKNVMVQLQRQNVPLPPNDVLEKQVLEQLINSRAQLEEAKDTGLNVDDAAVEKAIGRIAEGNNISTSQLQESLKKDGVDF